MSIRLSIKNQERIAQLARNYAAVSVKDESSKLLLQVGYMAEGEIKSAISMYRANKTGFMKASVRLSDVNFNQGNPSLKVGPDAYYAIYVHEGHRQQVGRYVPAIKKRLVRPFVQGKPFMGLAEYTLQNRVEGALKNFGKQLAVRLSK